jgi:hypothetical protein
MGQPPGGMRVRRQAFWHGPLRPPADLVDSHGGTRFVGFDARVGRSAHYRPGFHLTAGRVGCDPTYPDVSPRNAEALRQWDAMRKAAE